MVKAKIAISVPQDVLESVDQAARRAGETRSAYISKVLTAAVKARNDADITRRLNQVFADLDVAREQLRVAENLDAVGSDWSDESW